MLICFDVYKQVKLSNENNPVYNDTVRRNVYKQKVNEKTLNCLVYSPFYKIIAYRIQINNNSFNKLFANSLKTPALKSDFEEVW